MKFNKKLNVLVVPSDRTGVGQFRSINPHLALENLYPDEFSVHIDYEPQLHNDNWLKQFDIIHYHRTLGSYEEMESLVKRLNDMGIVAIMDIDDYWSPGPHHPAYLLIKNASLDEKIKNNIKVSKYITTTTEIFADEIKKLNKNVFVLPNAIDPTENQYIPKPEPSDKIRIGWLGGSCMTPDTEILTEDGWVRFDELKQTENVATLNHESKQIEYHKPTGYICTPFEGTLNCAKNDFVEYEVTPNHNMYASTSFFLDMSLIQSENIHNQNFYVKHGGEWFNKEQEYFTLCENKFVKMDDWVKIFAYWLANGFLTNRENINKVGFVNQNERNTNLIINLLTANNFKIERINKNDVVVLDSDLYDYFSQFNIIENPIPKEFSNLSKEQSKTFLVNYFNFLNVEKNKVMLSSKVLSDKIQEIGLKAGALVKIQPVSDKQNSSYSVEFYFDNQDKTLVAKEHQYTKHYKGNVYCVEVQNHIIYVRRNGKAFWVGNSHLHDLKLLDGLVGKLKSSGLMEKLQFVLCGFDLRGTHTEIDPVTKQQKVRNIYPKESVWYHYERIFTDDYRTISPEYKEFLLKFVQEEYPNVSNEPYRRVWTKHISTYATNYNLFDISLAPLEENIFNAVKSELKAIESGFHKKALIAQNFGPYKLHIKSAIKFGGEFDMNANGILIDSKKNHKDWFEAIKKLVNNPNMIKVLQDNLNESVKNKYSIEKVTEQRRELYLNLLNNKKQNQNL